MKWKALILRSYNKVLSIAGDKYNLKRLKYYPDKYHGYEMAYAELLYDLKEDIWLDQFIEDSVQHYKSGAVQVPQFLWTKMYKFIWNWKNHREWHKIDLE
jgi:hypothetical protein